MKLLDRYSLFTIRNIVLVTLALVICLGLVETVIPIKPFWVDEWFIIYNLKTKATGALFGKLALMQQFPRVYLILIKLFTSYFDYSYFSLRLPSFLVSLTVIILGYTITDRLFNKNIFCRYLFIIILISSFTFTEYFVQIKQYSMDILLSVVAIWQLLQLLKVNTDQPIAMGKYLFFCFSFLVVPFFSYTYPIVVIPIFIVALLRAIKMGRSKADPSIKRKTVILICVPLLVCTFSISLFYGIDIKQLTADNAMYGFWSFLIIDPNHKMYSFITSGYKLFSQLGAGLIYENLFGLLGTCAFLYGIYSALKNFIKKDHSDEAYIRIYCCTLLIVTFVLFLCKKLPLGTPRLNAFTVPSISILIIYLIKSISIKISDKLAKTITLILYLGAILNVYIVNIKYFEDPVYKKRMHIYTSTENAIRFAQHNRIPMLVTEAVSYPYEIAANPAGAPEPGVWMIKTFPAYKMNEQVPLFAINNLDTAKTYIKSLPPSVTTVLAGDGIIYHIVERY